MSSPMPAVWVNSLRLIWSVGLLLRERAWSRQGSPSAGSALRRRVKGAISEVFYCLGNACKDLAARPGTLKSLKRLDVNALKRLASAVQLRPWPPFFAIT